MEKIIRILSWINSWRINAHVPTEKRRYNYLSADDYELRVGHSYLFKALQASYFESDCLFDCHHSWMKRALSELVEDSNSYLSYEEKHPIIIPWNNHVTKLLVVKVHEDTLHGGSTLVQGHLCRQFWLVRGINFIHKILRQCVICTRHKGKVLQQQMGPLPAVRLRPTRPFTYTGVDYAGPFSLKFSLQSSYVWSYVQSILRLYRISPR